MPVFMHCRDAHERFMTLLEPWLDKLPGAVHCFTGTRGRDAGAWRVEFISALPVGFAMNDAGWSCGNCCR
ncbi:hypothetical protein ACVXHA_09220 [Escherichia coli]